MELTSSLLFLFIFPLLFLLVALLRSGPSRSSSVKRSPQSYPVIGPLLVSLAMRKKRVQWTSDLIRSSPTATYVLSHFGVTRVLTGNPANVQHILKTQFSNYQKGDMIRKNFREILGNGIFTVDGDSWKLQRQVASHEFNTKSLRKFVETVVDMELNDRLIPLLSEAAINGIVLDMQDVLQRFTFDNICKIAFGYDPACLSTSLPEVKFVQAFDEAAKMSSKRFAVPFPMLWKIKGMLNIGSERKLKIAVSEVREFALKIVREKKQEQLLRVNSLDQSVDLLSRFLNSTHFDEEFVIDIVISFILAGRDTTSSALTWYFWLLSGNQRVESEVVKEIKEKSEMPIYEDVKDMVYTHASLCESMRFYPPVAMDSKEAMCDDVLPDGTTVKKGMRVTYHPYAMGRSEKIWGPDWAEFRPERWLQKADEAAGKWCFVGRDSYTYPVFQAGPRICLGREMAFLQMKRVVSGVLRRFRVMSMTKEGVEPGFVTLLTSKMEGGFPVRIEFRDE